MGGRTETEVELRERLPQHEGWLEASGMMCWLGWFRMKERREEMSIDLSGSGEMDSVQQRIEE